MHQIHSLRSSDVQLRRTPFMLTLYVIIMQKYECGNCEKIFTEKERICENWRVKEKSVICLACKHYLSVIYDNEKSDRLFRWLVIVVFIFSFSYFIAGYVFGFKETSNLILRYAPFSHKRNKAENAG